MLKAYVKLPALAELHPPEDEKEANRGPSVTGALDTVLMAVGALRTYIAFDTRNSCLRPTLPVLAPVFAALCLLRWVWHVQAKPLPCKPFQQPIFNLFLCNSFTARKLRSCYLKQGNTSRSMVYVPKDEQAPLFRSIFRHKERTPASKNMNEPDNEANSSGMIHNKSEEREVGERCDDTASGEQ